MIFTLLNIKTNTKENKIELTCLNEKGETVMVIVIDYKPYFLLTNKNITSEKSADKWLEDNKIKLNKINLIEGNSLTESYLNKKPFLKIETNLDKYEEVISRIKRINGTELFETDYDVETKFMIKTGVRVGYKFNTKNELLLGKKISVHVPNITPINEKNINIPFHSIKIWNKFPTKKVAIYEKEECERIGMYEDEMENEKTNPLLCIIISEYKDSVITININTTEKEYESQKKIIMYIQSLKLEVKDVKVISREFETEYEMIKESLLYLEDVKILFGFNIQSQETYMKKRLVFFNKKIVVEHNYLKININTVFDNSESIFYNKEKKGSNITDILIDNFESIECILEGDLISPIFKSVACLLLNLKMNIISALFENAYLNVFTMEKEINKTVFNVVKNMLLVECKDNKVFIKQFSYQNKSKSEENKSNNSYKGGFITKIKSGFVNEIQSLIDLSSTYPSIFKTFNICYTTLLSKQEIEEIDLHETEYTSIYNESTGNKLYFVKEFVRKGILSSIMDKGMAMRSEIQNNITKDPIMLIKDKIIKKRNNCVYGFTGIPSVAGHTFIASSVTSICKNIIGYCINYIENLDLNYENGEVIISKPSKIFDPSKMNEDLTEDSYNRVFSVSTDSVLFRFPINEKYNTSKINISCTITNMIVNNLNEMFNQIHKSCISIKFECLYLRTLYLNGGNYFAMTFKPVDYKKYDSKINPDCFKLKECGTCTVRRDTIDFVKVLIREIVSNFFMMKIYSYSEFNLKEATRDAFDSFSSLDDMLLLKNFVFRSIIKKNFNEYQYNSMPNYIKYLYSKRSNIDNIIPPKKSIFKYYLVSPDDDSNMCIETEKNVIDNNINIKYSSYLNHLKIHMIKIFDIIFTDKKYGKKLSEEFKIPYKEGESVSEVFFKRDFAIFK